MKTTWYFRQSVLKRRPFIKMEWCNRAITNSDFCDRQPDGRFRYWKWIPEVKKYLRVVTLPDGETVHNAFLDRNFEEGD